jgi:hypothetical protein
MKAKLIKHGDYYAIIQDKKMVAFSTDLCTNDHLIGKLSQQNCDEEFAKAMEVVDVEKLADILNDISIDLADYQNEAGKGMSTNEEWKDLFIERVTASITSYETSERPTEIEVEIEMESILVGQCNCPCHTNKGIIHSMACCNPKRIEQPKLDSSGKLTLKRVV